MSVPKVEGQHVLSMYLFFFFFDWWSIVKLRGVLGHSLGLLGLSLASLEAPWGALEASWTCLGPVLGHLGPLLGPLGALLDPLGALLARSRGLLGRSWPGLGASWGDFLGACWHKVMLNRFGDRFWTDLEAQMGPPEEPKNAAQNEPTSNTKI